MADSRPLSPHMSIWKWQVHSITSIFHRITGNGLTFAGLTLFAWWLGAAASGREAYASFLDVATGPLGWIVGIGLSWFFFQHLLSGLRHLAMDSGWGYGLAQSKATATATWVGSLALTALFWGALLLGGR
jgi:succinate dehydrogenase / fumarate reductase cytochrome b subunit